MGRAQQIVGEGRCCRGWGREHVRSLVMLRCQQARWFMICVWPGKMGNVRTHFLSCIFCPTGLVAWRTCNRHLANRVKSSLCWAFPLTFGYLWHRFRRLHLHSASSNVTSHFFAGSCTYLLIEIIQLKSSSSGLFKIFTIKQECHKVYKKIMVNS